MLRKQRMQFANIGTRSVNPPVALAADRVRATHS